MADDERPDGNAPDGNAPRDLQSAGEGAPEAPVLVGPKEEALVDGTGVTLEWEAVEGADRYLVEVAEDAPFHEVVVQEEVDTTALTLPALPIDGALYYWRVVTLRGDEWSHGDRIESFVSVAAEQVRTSDSGGSAPDREEGYGPAAALFSAAGAEAAAEATGSEERFAEERRRGVAHEGVEAGQIMGFAGVVLVAIVLIVCVLFFWITSVEQETRDARAAGSVYPGLQAAETRAAQQLDQYELVSERDSAYRIPIEEAMRIIADEAYEGQRAGAAGGGQVVVPPEAASGADSARTDAFAPDATLPEGPPGGGR